MQFHVTHMTKSERIAEFLFSTTNWWKGSWINHICSFILYHNALSTLTLTVVRERWTVSGLIQEEMPEMKLLLSSAIVNGGSVQANSSISFRDLTVKCSEDWSLKLELPWPGARLTFCLGLFLILMINSTPRFLSLSKEI